MPPSRPLPTGSASSQVGAGCVYQSRLCSGRSAAEQAPASIADCRCGHPSIRAAETDGDEDTESEDEPRSCFHHALSCSGRFGRSDERRPQGLSRRGGILRGLALTGR